MLSPGPSSWFSSYRRRRRPCLFDRFAAGLAVASDRRPEPHDGHERVIGIAGSFVGYHVAGLPDSE